MFNIYYINYAKAYEISMLIDNKLPEEKTKEKESNISGHLDGEFDDFDYKKYENMRDINSRLMKKISDEL